MAQLPFPRPQQEEQSDSSHRQTISRSLLTIIHSLHDEGADLKRIENKLRVHFPAMIYRPMSHRLEVDVVHDGLNYSLTFSLYNEIQPEGTVLTRVDKDIHVTGFHYVDTEDDEEP